MEAKDRHVTEETLLFFWDAFRLVSQTEIKMEADAGEMWCVRLRNPTFNFIVRNMCEEMTEKCAAIALELTYLIFNLTFSVFVLEFHLKSWQGRTGTEFARLRLDVLQHKTSKTLKAITREIARVQWKSVNEILTHRLIRPLSLKDR